jgi:predicted nicotinamide N-methyase
VIEDRRAFILANTRLQSPPHTPELRLHLADEITPIWRMTEEGLEAIGVPPPFWAFAWAGGQALARWVLYNPHEVRDRRVLDFACGGGLVGIAAALSGGQVEAVDIDHFCADAVGLNAEANGVEIDFRCEDLLDRPPPAADVILAGDISYEKPTALRVRAWLLRAHGAGARVLMGDPGRSYFEEGGLAQLAEYQVATTRELEDQEVKRTGVWTFG